MLIPGCTGSPRSAASLSRRVSRRLHDDVNDPGAGSDVYLSATANGLVWMAAEKIEAITPLLQDCAKRLAALSLVSPAFNSR